MVIIPGRDDNDELQHQTNHDGDDDDEDLQHQSNHHHNNGNDGNESDDIEHDELLDEQEVHVIRRPDSSPVPTSCPEIDELEDASQAIELPSDPASPAVSESVEREDLHSEEMPTMSTDYGLRSKTRALSAAPEATPASRKKWKLKKERQGKGRLNKVEEERGVEDGGGRDERGAGLQRAASEFGDLNTEAVEELLEAVEAVEALHSSEGSPSVAEAVVTSMQTARTSPEQSQLSESSMISSARKTSDIATQTASTAPGSHGPVAPIGSHPIPISSTRTEAPGELTPMVTSTPLTTSNHGATQHVTHPPTLIDESSDATVRVRSEATSQLAPQPSTPRRVVVSGQLGLLQAPVLTRAQAKPSNQSTAQISVRSNDSRLQARQLQSTSAPSRSFIRSISAPNLVRRDTAELDSPLPDLSQYTLFDAADFLPQVGSKSIDKGKKRAIDVMDVSSGSEEDGGDEMEDDGGESESSDMQERGGDTEDEAYRDLNVAVARLDGEETESYNEDEGDSDTCSERSALRSSQRTSPTKRGRPSQGEESSTRGRGRPRGRGRGRGGKSHGQFSGRTILGFYSTNRQERPVSTENIQTSNWTQNRPTYASLEGVFWRASVASLTRPHRSSSLSLTHASPNDFDDRDTSPHLPAFDSLSTSFSAHPEVDHTMSSLHRTQAAPPPTPSPSQLSPQFSDDKKLKTLRRMLSEANTMRSVADQMRDSWIEFQNAYGRYTQDHILLGQETSGCQGRIAEQVHFHVGLSSDVHLFAAAMQRVLDDGAGVAPKLRFRAAARRGRDG
ncbi:Ubiquitin carboxyl-terminal hydrolase [Pseudozyma hubeiensis]|nr:Ubiquitin carboxyl-terminal hydrolase [Pseudozyma hubeiensis]